ncbi:hypothetical protein GQ54DRAFT_318242 [Martensiomyces pterosporus]|nr:hypothetical protein GQ54DRAFT_318242 [Martensiomyces pterosporus]
MAKSDERILAAKGASTEASVDASSLHLLVYSYLLHNNCGRTAKAFARTCGLATSGRLTNSSTPEYLSSLFNSVDDEEEEEEEEEDEEEDVDIDGAVMADASCKGKQGDAAMASGTKNVGKRVSKRQSVSDMAVDSESSSGSFASSGSSATRSSAGRKDSGVVSRQCHGALPTAEQERQSVETERANELIDHHIEYLHIRQSICSSIEAGEPEVALDLLSTYFRAVLIPPPSEQLLVSSLPLRREFNATLLRFRLDTQYYVELVANHQELDALRFGQRTLWRYPDIFDTWLNNSLGFGTQAGSMLNAYQQQNSASSRGAGGGAFGRADAGAARASSTRGGAVDSRKHGPLSAATSNGDRDAGSRPRQLQQQGCRASKDPRECGGLYDEIVPREELKQQRAEIMQHITNVAALVAYPDPHKSPLADLLSQDRRRELAISVNTAILQSMHFPKEPALVTLVRQLATTSAYLVGYRSSTRSSAISGDGSADGRKPWVLDTFMNSDTDTDLYA